jgi:hypothetical protein
MTDSECDRELTRTLGVMENYLQAGATHSTVKGVIRSIRMKGEERSGNSSRMTIKMKNKDCDGEVRAAMYKT